MIEVNCFELKCLVSRAIEGFHKFGITSGSDDKINYYCLPNVPMPSLIRAGGISIKSDTDQICSLIRDCFPGIAFLSCFFTTFPRYSIQASA